MDYKELKYRQSWNIYQKIDHSIGVIEDFISKTNGMVYVSFSGGKDSTVLLDLCRMIDKNIKAVYCNTGNEYPDVVKFVRCLKNKPEYNIDIIYPKFKPIEVIDKYGFPLISKEQSSYLYDIRRSKSEKLKERRLNKKRFKLSNKYRFLIYKKYDISSKCCEILKKKPFHRYEKETGLYPIIGTMADESRLRVKTYIREGSCNVFNDKKKKSSPLSIWTENDIYEYIKIKNIQISDIYSKGLKRTGCMFCGYGCQFKNDNRLQLLYDLYPKFYQNFMKYNNNGISYREAIRDVLKINGLFLPDEEPKTLFDFIN